MGGIGLEWMDKMNGELRMMLKNSVGRVWSERGGGGGKIYLFLIGNAWGRKPNTNIAKTLVRLNIAACICSWNEYTVYVAYEGELQKDQFQNLIMKRVPGKGTSIIHVRGGGGGD